MGDVTPGLIAVFLLNTEGKTKMAGNLKGNLAIGFLESKEFCSRSFRSVAQRQSAGFGNQKSGFRHSPLRPICRAAKDKLRSLSGASQRQAGMIFDN